MPPFHVMDLLAAAGERQRTHGELVNLAPASPALAHSAAVTAEAIRPLHSELRDAIARHHKRTHGLDVAIDATAIIP